ncbi:hypothetical protein [Embleya sp. AB8]|uniref:hypothetical protein n=1 Tax=Embleya sp. AB8 TaxID=3156304 RepID=UPI003C712DB4
MRLDYLTHVTGPGDARTAYREATELATAAEEFGYDSCQLAQHHLGAQGALAQASGGYPVDFTPTDYLALGNMHTGAHTALRQIAQQVRPLLTTHHP